MTVEEYREKHPNCRYCKYSFDVALFSYYCNAKEKYIVLNEAKKCEIYKAKGA